MIDDDAANAALFANGGNTKAAVRNLYGGRMAAKGRERLRLSGTQP